MFTIPPHRFVVLSLAMAVAGCMPPMGSGYMGPGYPYQQPMYAPPGSLNAPGTLVIPQPSNAPYYNPSNPSGTYESNPSDTWKAPGGAGTAAPGSTTGSGTTFEADDAVPKPKEPGAGSPFYNDLNGGTPGTSVSPPPGADGLTSELPTPELAEVRPSNGWKTR